MKLALIILLNQIYIASVLASPYQVTITKGAALESVSPSGIVTDIQEALPGRKFYFVALNGKYLTLKDADGHCYQVEEAATDCKELPLISADDYLGGPVSEEDVSQISLQGKRNLETLLSDHPELLTIIQKYDVVWQWLAVHFSNNGNPIIWSNKQIEFHNYIAIHSYTGINGEPILYLAKKTREGYLITPECQISGLVFELLNASHEAEFMKNVELARQGKLSKDDFAVSMAKIEFKTCHETKNFFSQIWLPYATSKKVPLDGDWHNSVGDSFEQWLYFHRVVLKDGYPDDAYSSYYKDLVSH